MQWKDVSSHSPSDKERTPNAFEARMGVLRVTIVRPFLDRPYTWLLACVPFFSLKELHSRDIAVAQSEALALVRAALERELAALD